MSTSRSLARARGQDRDEARGVVQKAVDPQRHLSPVDPQARPVADVGVPELAGPFDLPATAPLVRPLGLGRAVPRDQLSAQALGREQSAYRRRLDRAPLDPPFGDQRLHDQRHRSASILPPDLDDQLALFVAQRPGVAGRTPFGAGVRDCEREDTPVTTRESGTQVHMNSCSLQCAKS